MHGQRRGDDVAHQAALSEQFCREPRKAERRVGLARRQRCDYQRLAPPGLLQIFAREEERLAVAEQRVADCNLLRPLAAHSHQNDDVRVVEQQQDRVAERGGPQPVPVKPGTLRAQPEIPGQFQEA